MAVTLIDGGTGQLPNAKGTLYTTPGATTAGVKVTLVNTGAGANTVNLYAKKDGANSRRCSPKDLSLESGASWTSEVQTLTAADLIEGDASTAAEVDYTINGFEVA